MADNDFHSLDTSSEDEVPFLLSDHNTGTETLDLSSLLTRDLTFSGSFDVKSVMWTTAFGKLTQALPLSAILIERSHKIIFANQACARISAEYESIIDTEFARLFPESDVSEKMRALVEEVFTTRKPRLAQAIMEIGKNRIWGRITFRSIRLRDNRLVLALVEDLTPEKRQIMLNHRLNEDLRREIEERKKTELRLSESEKKYRQVVETAGDMIYQTDPKGHFTLVNHVGVRLTGYSEEELIGGFYADLIRPDFRRAVEEFYQAQLSDRLPITYFEFPIVAKHGETVWVGQNVQLLTDDKTVVGFQAIARDITERKKAEESLRQSETRYKDLFDHATDGIYTHDLQGNFTSVNEAACRTIGYPREVLLRMNFRDIVDPNHLPSVEENLSRKVRNGMEKTGPYEALLRTKDGGPLWIEVTSRIITEDGQPVAVHGTARDVTERKHLEERLFQAAKMEAIGTLAGGLAHDFNNLLQVVLGYAELISFGKERADKDFQRARSIHDAATRGRDLVNRILTFSRRVETKLRPIDLNYELMQVDELLHRTIPKMIDIQLRLTDKLFPINADPTQIEQILLNLAVNAAHAMPDGGKLVFETANVWLDEEYCRTHPEAKPGEYVLLTVSDTGHGMGKDILDRAFEPFFTTKDPGEGTGLGLPMVFAIVKSHGGFISCDSSPGGGAVFRLYFPAEENEIFLDPSSTQQMPAFGTETILLVEDEESIRNLAVQILSSAGYKVLVASTGRQALEVYEKAPDEISLVVLDLMMPEMGGQRCLDELLKINPSAKILIATGHPLRPSNGENWAHRAKGLVSKPYKVNHLLGAVRHALDTD